MCTCKVLKALNPDRDAVVHRRVVLHKRRSAHGEAKERSADARQQDLGASDRVRHHECVRVCVCACVRVCVCACVKQHLAHSYLSFQDSIHSMFVSTRERSCNWPHSFLRAVLCLQKRIWVEISPSVRRIGVCFSKNDENPEFWPL
jgi:hypothetical protein